MTQRSDTHTIATTPIEGLLIVNLPLHGDERGWFKEHWQRDKMVALGLPDFQPVQQNISFNAEAGTTRGIHAEPWDKYVSVANGKAFGAWVDLRDGPGFGKVFTTEISPRIAVFVPRGVANAFQTLTPDVNYLYLVNEHWSPSAKYSYVSLADPALGISWPVALEDATISAKDIEHPFLSDVTPVSAKQTVVLGSNGQLGRALRDNFGTRDVKYLTRENIDLSDPSGIEAYDWSQVETIINAAAFTSVDLAETNQGRISAWQINAQAAGTLADICKRNDITLVSFSSDYVFDGTTEPHYEDEPLSPLGVYGQSKAAGDIAVARVPKHFIVRTSWVVGDGTNFVRTLHGLALKGVEPSVIDDQTGRLTFAHDLARGVKHLLSARPQYGTYNLSGSGDSASWYEIALCIFEYCGVDPKKVKPVSSSEYLRIGSTETRPFAPRPHKSLLSLDKITGTGFLPTDWRQMLKKYLKHL